MLRRTSAANLQSMPLNGAELYLLLRGFAPKALFAAVLTVGFLFTLPFWLASSPEQKQHLIVGTASKQAVATNVGPLLDILPEEKEHLKQMLKPVRSGSLEDMKRRVWQLDLAGVIQPWVADIAEAEAIARWVTIYSDRFDLSPDLVLAVIAVESHFDRFAVSNAGARGLMQVMPFWKDHLGSRKDNLLDIETNIRYGCAIIRMYLDRYGHLAKALAAYNGSRGSGRYPGKVFERMKTFKATAQDLVS